MLLTCNVSSIGQLLRGNKQRPAQLKLLDVPAYVKDELGLHGLSISTDLLVGSTPDRLNAFRERADKAGCACLLLIESEPQPLGDPDDEKGFAAIDRGKRVLQAASLLGCNSAAIRVEAADDDESMERVVDRIREILPVADKLDIYLALRPHEGLTADPERLTDTIKKIGGFRVATLPDLQVAAGQDDPAAYLRRITPYASAVLAQTFEFAEVQAPEIDDDKPASLDDLAEALVAAEAPEHTTYALEPLIAAIASVGFDGTIAIDYRGEGDPTLGVLQSRDALDAALEAVSG